MNVELDWRGSAGTARQARGMRRQIETRRDGEKFVNWHGEDQGFVDQDGEWMSREEVYRAAPFAAGQIAYPDACGRGPNGPRLVYSEGVY